MSLRRTVYRGSAYLALRHLISVGLKAIGLLIITRALGPTHYGAFVAAAGIYQFALSAGQTGVGTFLLRQAGDLDEGVVRTATTILLALSMAIVGLVLILAGIHGDGIGPEGAAVVLSTMILALPLQCLSIPAMARLERDLDYRSVTTCEIASQVIYYAFALPLVWYGNGALGLAQAYVGQQLALLLLAHRYAARRPVFGWDRASAVWIGRYVSSFSAATWVWQTRNLINPLIVGTLLGAHAVGIIGMTIGILEMLTIVKTIALRLAIVVLARFQASVEKMREGVSEGMLLQTLAVGTVVLGFGWFGEIIVPIFFGERWLPILEIYPYLALGYFANAQFNMHSAVLSVLERNRDLAIFHGVHVAIFATTAYLAVPVFGIVGYGFAECASLAAYGLVHFYLARAVGSPDYRVAALWAIGVGIGLFWRQLGLWAIAVPFLALAMPPSLRQLAIFAARLRKTD